MDEARLREAAAMIAEAPITSGAEETLRALLREVVEEAIEAANRHSCTMGEGVDEYVWERFAWLGEE